MQGECLDHWSISLSLSGQLSVRPVLLQQRDEEGGVFEVQQWLRIEWWTHIVHRWNILHSNKTANRDNKIDRNRNGRYPQNCKRIYFDVVWLNAPASFIALAQKKPAVKSDHMVLMSRHLVAIEQPPMHCSHLKQCWAL